MDLGSVIASLFRTYGYTVRSQVSGAHYILAVKDDAKISIGYQDTGELTSKDILNFLAHTEADEPEKSIFITVSGIVPELRSIAEDGGVTLWEKDKLEKEIGRALIKDVEDIRNSQPGVFLRGILGDVPKELELSLHSDDITSEKAQEMGIIVPMAELAQKFGGGLTGEPEKTSLKTEGDKFLSPKLDKDDAMNQASKTLSNVSIALQMLPYFVYDYSCTISQGTDAETEITGRLALNTVMGDIYKWGEDENITNHIDGEYSKLSPQIDDGTAQRKIKDTIIELNTKIVESQEETDSVTIIEKKKVKPKEEAIQITKANVVYLPIWCAEGSNGQMIIDATSGEVMKSSS